MSPALAALTWLALAAAVLLIPLGDPVAERTNHLARHGRLRSPPTHVRRRDRLRIPRAVSTPPAAAGLAGLVALFGVGARAGPITAAAAAIAMAAIVYLALAAVRQRAAARSIARLLAAVRLIAAELSAGTRPDAALLAAAELDPSRAAVFAAAADALASGGDASAEFAAQPELAPLARAWAVAAVSGAPIATVLGRVAADLDARAEQDRAVQAALAGARSAAVVLAALPLLGTVLGVAMGADPLRFLLGSPAGQVVLLGGVALDVAGVLWTRRLAAAAARS